jgi:hypothetical protein
MNIPDHIFRELRNNFWVQILKFFGADADPGSGNLFYPGSGIGDGKKILIQIRVEHPRTFIPRAQKQCWG